MPRTGFDPQMRGFAFVNWWRLDEVEKQRLYNTFAVQLTRATILGAAAFGMAGAVLARRGILALRGKVEKDLAQGYGLCGGMCFTALDFYRANLPLPRRRNRDDHRSHV